MQVTNEIPLFTGAMACYPYSASLHNLFKFISRFGDAVDMSVHEGNLLYVPREVVPLGKEDYRIKFEPRALECTYQPRNEEQEVLPYESLEALLTGHNHVFEAPTGWGKCQRYGTNIIMANGQKKKVEDVKVGDVLLGPDSTPRIVQQLGKGYGKMFKITPIGEEPFWVNEDHILSLKCTGGAKFGGYQKGNVVNITIKDYLQKSKTFKHCFKLWRPDGVDFIRKDTTTINPYVLGLLLGDGCIKYNRVYLHSADPDLSLFLEKEVIRWNCFIRPIDTGNVCIAYAVLGRGNTNSFMDELRDMGVHGKGAGNKRIPIDYLLSSREQRLQLIAGLIDTDGYYDPRGKFDFVSKSKELAEQMVFLCRSVGLAARIKECQKECVNTGVWGTYYRVLISGHLDRIPTRLERKQAKPRQQIKDVLVRGFTVEEDGEGWYFGFVLDKDHLYLGENFIVQHNTVAGALIACLLGQPTMIVVNKQDLMDAWYDAIVNVLGISPSLVGQVQQNTCDYQGKRLVIGMAKSLCIPGRYPPELFKYFGCLIVDEVHQMPTEMFSRVFQLFPAYYRLGFSATPDRTDGKWKVIRCHVGPTLIKGTIVPMVPKILVKKTGWKIPTYKEHQDDGTYKEVKIPHSPGRMMLVNKAMTNNQVRNSEIVEFTVSAYKKGRRTLLLSETRDHLDRLFQMLTSIGVPGNHIGYYVGGLKKYEREMVKKDASIILGTYKMCMTGTDCPVWDTLVFGTPRADIRQCIGRVIRAMDGKRQPVALDLLDYDAILNAFFKNRLKYYYALKAQVVRMD